MPSFLCNARYFLVTYAQCGSLDPHKIVVHFSELGAECIIGRERHSDGGIHLHVFVDFGRKFRSRRTDIFDVDNRHPNIEHSRGTPWKGYDYVIKEGDVVGGGLERPLPTDRSQQSVSIWSDITGAESPEEFWRLCEELAPRALATNFTSLAKFVEWRFRPIPAPYETPGGFTFVQGDVDGRDEWLSQSGIGMGEPRVGTCPCGAKPYGYCSLRRCTYVCQRLRWSPHRGPRPTSAPIS